ncbi:hypothetical protein IQ238_06290 [Pleurocapsales cyanobacterium LEGE 06147]|nr:hypothetical protein [Pleurocapsales cyanobacterium LEGE 06147]
MIGLVCAGLSLAIALPVTAQTTQTQPSPTESESVPQNSQPQERQRVFRPTSQPEDPIATITPDNGKVDVELKNNTNAEIEYQALGYTENQVLEGGEEHTLLDLPIPVTIRMARQDDGFIKVLPISSTEGKLEVSLDEDRNYYDDPNLPVMEIHEDGKVFVY